MRVCSLFPAVPIRQGIHAPQARCASVKSPKASAPRAMPPTHLDSVLVYCFHNLAFEQWRQHYVVVCYASATSNNFHCCASNALHLPGETGVVICSRTGIDISDRFPFSSRRRIDTPISACPRKLPAPAPPTLPGMDVGTTQNYWCPDKGGRPQRTVRYFMEDIVITLTSIFRPFSQTERAGSRLITIARGGKTVSQGTTAFVPNNVRPYSRPSLRQCPTAAACCHLIEGTGRALTCPKWVPDTIKVLP
jgi:hypothetical protein